MGDDEQNSSNGNGEKIPRRYNRMADLYRPDWDTKARKLAAYGLIDEEIADFFGINLGTLHDIKVEYPTFADALQRGKDVIDNRVENALLSRAIGFVHEVEKVFCSEGEIVRTTVNERVLPDPRACQLWLMNRRPSQWRTPVHKANHDAGKAEARERVGYERARRVALVLRQAKPSANGKAH